MDETLTGTGKIFSAGEFLCRARYEIHFHEHVAEEPVLGEKEEFLDEQKITGRVFARPEDLSSCLDSPTPLTLHLEDGRRLDFFVVDGGGKIADASGRGIYSRPS